VNSWERGSCDHQPAVYAELMDSENFATPTAAGAPSGTGAELHRC